MNPETNLLQDLLRRARSRRQLLLSLRGVAISLGVVAALLLLTGCVAHRFRYNGGALLALGIGALLMVLATIYFALLRPLLKRISEARLASADESHVPGREQRFRDARYRKRDPPFATVAVRRCRACQLADLRGRVEVGTKRDLRGRRSVSDTNNARSIAQRAEH